MKKLLFYTVTLCTVFALSNSNNPVYGQPPGICKNVQKCNNDNFSATENNDLNAGEFYNSYPDDNVNVVHSEYTGAPVFARAYFGKSQPADGVGIGARFEAGFCAIEAFTVTGGTNPPGAQLFGTFNAAIGGAGTGTVSFGTVGLAGGMDSTVNIGVFGQTHDFGGSGVTNYAGFFAGDVFVTGTFMNPSDAKLKQNTRNLENSLTKLSSLSAKSYEYNTQEYEFMHLPKGEQYGFLAQELEEVFPHLVSKNIFPATSPRRTELPQHPAVEFKGINYVGMIPIMVEAINEQTAMIDEKDQRISELEAQLDRVLTRLETIESKLEIEGSDLEMNTPSIKQNQPNPTNGSTSIEYYLPENTSSAFLRIYNVAGQEVQSYSLSDRGHSRIDVDLKGSPSGALFYSLFVNGIAVDTKKMMVTAQN